jgi:hypothetical protein
MRLNVQTNFPAITQQLQAIGNQLPYVSAVALTRTAKDVQPAIKARMLKVFDRPVNYTLNGMFIKPATKTSLESAVWLKDKPGAGTPVDRYLGPQIQGGVRGQKGMESALVAAGFMRRGHFAVPASGAQIDANGNMRRGQIVQMLAELKVAQRTGREGRVSRRVVRQGTTWFALPVAYRGLAAGVYFKRKSGRGTTTVPVLIFVDRARYRPRLPFEEVGISTALARFPVHFEAEARKVLDSTRLR